MASTPHRNTVRTSISADLLADLYVRQRHTFDDVAAYLGVSPTTVRRRLRDLAVSARPRGPLPAYVDDPRFVLGAPFAWTGDVAYIVGLIATDGCLSKNGRTIAIASTDEEILRSVRAKLNGGAIGFTTTGRGQVCYRYQLSNRGLYVWLTGIGLMPAKSLTLGELAVPDEVFRDFVRGCIDGDGSILTYVDRFNTAKSPSYVYDRLYVSIVSASPIFLRWIQRQLRRLCEISGDLGVRRAKHPRHHDQWRLRYAKRESARLLRWIYHSPDIMALRRKQEAATQALASVTWYRRSLSDRDRR
jgi:hypothetical protein